MIADVLNDEIFNDSGTNGNNVVDSLSSATANPSHGIRCSPLSLPKFSGVLHQKSETSSNVWHHTLKAVINEEQLSCRCCMVVSCVHHVAISNGVFCITCSLLMLVEDVRGDHMEEVCSRAGLKTPPYM